MASSGVHVAAGYGRNAQAAAELASQLGAGGVGVGAPGQIPPAASRGAASAAGDSDALSRGMVR
ncbi:MAG TPA: hypothetical protein VFW64_11730 [Pseudonocardiaceae bacterium]|nr:hypothetical protein [Pseudonocardiaceae bacterium]